MRSYAEPIIAHPDQFVTDEPTIDRSTTDRSTADPTDPGQSCSDRIAGPPRAFLWRGRHYAVRSVVATWLDQAPWWRTAAAPVRRCWRVEATAGMSIGISLVDLSCDADGVWQLVCVHD